MKKVIISIILVFVLIGCSPMNSKFDCPNKPGINCRSLGQVNEMVDRGIIGRDITTKSIRVTSFYPAYYRNKNNFSNSGSFLRSGEQVMRIWIAAYQDIHNNYHNESTLYTVIHKNTWTVPKEVKE
jgi:conjugal transfer pilus assembly protein TraV